MLVLLATLLLAGSAAAQSWSEHTRTGELAFAVGKMERAEAELRAALEIAQGFPEGDPRLETSLENLAKLYENLHRLDEAQPLLELLLAAQEERSGTTSPRLLDTLLALGRICVRSGDIPGAEAHLKRYVAISDQQRSNPEAEPPSASDTDRLRAVLSILSEVVGHQGRTEEALELQRRSVALITPESMLTQSEKADQLESLAQLELLHGSVDEGERLLREAIRLRVADEDPRSEAQLLAEAARTAFDAGETALTERLASDALARATEPERQERAFKLLADVAWLEVRRGSNGLDTLLAAAGDTPELETAEQRLQAVLDLQRGNLPESLPEVLETTSRLVQVQTLRGHVADAAQTQRSLIELRRQAGGPALARALDDLAVLLVAAGSTEEACQVTGELIDLLSQDRGPEHEALLAPLARQLELLKELHRRKEARAVKKRLRKLERALR
jgi:tetratricopeptide (TPR) repeat protein